MQFQQFRKQNLTLQLHLLQIRLLSSRQRLNSKFTNGHETLVLIPSIDEKRLSRKYPVKVRPFPGALADDMHHYLRPLLQKYPDTTILHVGTNNCENESSFVAPDKILMLKTFIQNSPP